MTIFRQENFPSQAVRGDILVCPEVAYIRGKYQWYMVGQPGADLTGRLTYIEQMDQYRVYDGKDWRVVPDDARPDRAERRQASLYCPYCSFVGLDEEELAAHEEVCL